MTDNTMIKTALLCAAAALAGMPAMAIQAQNLLPAQAGDLVAAHAISAKRTVIANDERQALSFFQPLAADEALSFTVQPYQAESREYWQRVDAAQLQAGHALALTSASAVVMISPGVRAPALEAGQVQILQQGRALALDQAAQTLVDSASARQAGMELAAGSIGFRLRPGLEGEAVLRIERARGDYLVHVFEPESRHRLGLQADTDIVHAGATLEANLQLLGGAHLDAATALLIAPDGRSWDMALAADHSQARIQLPAGVPVQPGLWQIHASAAAIDGRTVFQRDARTAVAVVVPTARLDGRLQRQATRRSGGLTLDLGIEVATEGRYELRGVLFGNDADGRPVPVGVAHAANWLAPGQASLSLSFPADALAGLSAPWQLRDLRLTDQSAVAVIERRDRAAVITD